MKTYKSFEDIDKELKRLRLERDIAWEEVKLNKNKLIEDIQPPQWINSGFRLVSKYVFWLLFKRFLK